MVYWRTYRITNRENRSSYIRFHLDGYVNYSGGSEKYVDTKSYYPFSSWHECNYIEIDNDQTRYNSSGYEYTDTVYVRLTSCCHHGCHGHCDHGTSEALKESQSKNSTLTSENTQLRGELLNKTKEIGERDKQVAVVGKDLEFTQGQLTKTEGELTGEKEKVKELTGLFNKFTNWKWQ